MVSLVGHVHYISSIVFMLWISFVFHVQLYLNLLFSLLVKH